MFEPQKGILPLRPASLKHPTGLKATRTEAAVIEILATGKAVACGGISIIGHRGHIVRIISLLQIKDKNFHGWLFTQGHPNKKPGFEFIDATIGSLNELPFPDYMTYFVGEVDKAILQKDILVEELESITQFIIPFISNDGPPTGIDW